MLQLMRMMFNGLIIFYSEDINVTCHVMCVVVVVQW